MKVRDLGHLRKVKVIVEEPHTKVESQRGWSVRDEVLSRRGAKVRLCVIIPCPSVVLSFVADIHCEIHSKLLAFLTYVQTVAPSRLLGQVCSLPGIILLWLHNRYVNEGSHPPWSSCHVPVTCLASLNHFNSPMWPALSLALI